LSNVSRRSVNIDEDNSHDFDQKNFNRNSFLSFGAIGLSTSKLEHEKLSETSDPMRSSWIDFTVKTKDPKTF